MIKYTSLFVSIVLITFSSCSQKEKVETELAARMKIQSDFAKTIKAEDRPQEDSGGTTVIFF